MNFPVCTALTLCSVVACTTQSAERILGAARSPAGSIGVTLSQDNEQLILVLGDSLRVPLKTHGTSGGSSALGAPESLKLANGAEALVVPITFTESPQTSQALSVLLIRSSSAAPWSLQREWVVERSGDGKDGIDSKAGSKDESQIVTALADGALRRQIHHRNVENCEYTLPCGCCKAIQTRTIECDEDETYSFDTRRELLERRAYRKWYVVQPGEGLLAVARKALGDPRRLARLYALNSTLKPGATLTEGQKILVERE